MRAAVEGGVFLFRTGALCDLGLPSRGPDARRFDPSISSISAAGLGGSAAGLRSDFSRLLEERDCVIVGVGGKGPVFFFSLSLLLLDCWSWRK